MTNGEKKSLYEKIMNEVAKHVKSALNESASLNKKLTFKELDDMLNGRIWLFDEPKRGIFIKVSDSDLGFAIERMIASFYKRVLPIDETDAEGFICISTELEYKNPLHSFSFAIIEKFEDVDVDAYPIIADMASGKLQDKTIVTPIIVVSTIVPDDKSFMQRFKYYEFKY